MNRFQLFFKLIFIWGCKVTKVSIIQYKMVTLYGTLYNICSPHEVLLHTLGRPRYIRQYNKVVCTHLLKLVSSKISPLPINVVLQN